MIIFWILASGLLAIALLFVVIPLLSKRQRDRGITQDELNITILRQQLAELDADLAGGRLDQGQYDAARRDIERELLHDVEGAKAESGGDIKGQPVLAGILALGVAGGAIALYLDIGSRTIIPELERLAAGEPAVPQAKAAQHTGGSLEDLVAQLADKMEREPDNLEGWMMLGRSYYHLQQPQKALYALGRAYALAPEQADVVTAYAEALASNAGGRMAGKPLELVDTALEIDPSHVNARWLKGLAMFQAGRFEDGIARWELLLASLEPESEQAKQLEAYIEEARGQLAAATASQPSASGESEGPGSDATKTSTAEGSTETVGETPESATGIAETNGVTVDVSLADELFERAEAEDTLFVYAKAANGPPMPLAVFRGRVADLPLTVTLDDSMAMMPQMSLSQFDTITVGARISETGEATPQSGDFEGEIASIQRDGTGPVRVVIDRVRP